MYSVFTTIKYYILGLLFHHVQEWVHMKNQQEGIRWYAEFNTSIWGNYTRSLFLPIEISVWYLCIVILFHLSPKKASKLKYKTTCFYLGVYSQINLFYTCLVVLYYSKMWSDISFTYNTIYYSGNGTLLKHKAYKQLSLYASYMFIVFHICLIVSRIIFVDDPFMELIAIPNAILYAPFYSVYHPFEHFIHL